MKNLPIVAFIFVVLINILSSCNTTDLSPAFVRIDTIYVNTATNQGTASHNAQTVWVYANDQPLGVFELPTVVPILEEGSTDIIILKEEDVQKLIYQAHNLPCVPEQILFTPCPATIRLLM